ncbi:MAG TPA: Gfo/Idh/MocA family oxidoreductase [Terriglobales bacterium]|nr:Gfo/Idh/MocA family oxidoreductase [Terriglobales bacterium]
MLPLRIGLIGCGHMGRFVHLNILRRLPQVEVVALAESDAQRRKAASRKVPRAAAFADYHELLDRSEIDATVICLPNALHAEAATAALQSGKHLYLEKPIAINLDDGRKLLEVWRRSGRVAMIGFSYRFNPLHQQVRRHIQAGRLGELIAVRSVFTTAPHLVPEWKQRRASGGGALLDLASHHVDLVRFWFDQRPLEVHATIKSERVEADTATLELRFANGLVIQSFFSMSSVDDDRFEIYGRNGKLSLDRYNSWAVQITSLTRSPSAFHRFSQAVAWLPRSRFAISKLFAQANEPSFAAALAHFVTAARNGAPASPDFEDGFQSLAVIIAAEESARTGHSVPLAPFPE